MNSVRKSPPVSPRHTDTRSQVRSRQTTYAKRLHFRSPLISQRFEARRSNSVASADSSAPEALGSQRLEESTPMQAPLKPPRCSDVLSAAPERLTNGCTSLMFACQQGDLTLLFDQIRSKPERIRLRDSRYKNALHYCAAQSAVQAGDLVAAASIAVAAPELLESADEDGFTPLHLAVIQGNLAMVNLLLANKADVNAVDKEGHTVVHWATVCGEVGALRAVLAAGADVISPDINGGSPLHYAAQMCGATYEGKLSPATSNKLALEILGILLAHPQCNVDAEDRDGRQALLWAASAGSAKAVLALVKAGARVECADKDGLTALHCAASRGHTECIDALVSLCGAPTDLIDSNGCTALHYAVTLGHADATSRLLDFEADPNRQDRKGRTPAHCGCAKGQFETLKLLRERNANLWLRNAKGDLPLHEAASSGRRKLVEWLLEQQPKQVNTTSNEGRCLLHIAALNDYTDMCKMLLDYGAEVNAAYRNSKGVVLTPLDCALQKGHRSTAKFLQSLGGLPAAKLKLTPRPVNPFDHSSVDVVRPLQYADKQETLDFKNSKNYEVHLRRSESDAGEEGGCSCTEQTYKREQRYAHTCRRHKRHKRHKPRRRTSSCGAPRESDEDGDGMCRSRSNIEIGTRKNHERYSSSSECEDVEEDEDSCENCCYHKRKKQRVIHRRKSTPSSKRTRDRSDSADKGREDRELAASITVDEGSQTQIDASASEEIVGENQPKNEDGLKTDMAESNDQTSPLVSQTEATDELLLETETKIPVCGTADEPKSTLSEASVSEPIIVKISAQERTDDEDAAVPSNEPSAKLVSEEASAEDISKEALAAVDAKGDSGEVENIQIAADAEFRQSSDQTQTPKKTVESDLRGAVAPSNSVGDCSTADVPEESTATISRSEAVASQPLDVAVPHDGASETAPQGTEVEEAPSGECCAEPCTAEQCGPDPKQQSSEPGVATQNTEIVSRSQPTSENAVVAVDSSAVGAPSTADEASMQGRERETRRSFTLLPSDSADEEVPAQQESTARRSSFHVLRSDESAVELEGANSPKDDIELSDSTVFKVLTATHNRQAEEDSHKPVQEGFGRNNDQADGRYVSPERAQSLSGAAASTLDFVGRKRRLKKRVKSGPKSRAYWQRNEPPHVEVQHSTKDHDSGFEPSPRTLRTKIPTPRDTYTAHPPRRPLYTTLDGRTCSSRTENRKAGDKGACDMSAVTRSIQRNIRRYYMERKIFQHLLELKSLQIRSNKLNEAVLVKRAVDDYHKSCTMLGGETGSRLRRYNFSEYSFKNFELFLYETLKALQKPGTYNFQNINEVYEEAERRLSPDYNSYEKALQCTTRTHRCLHAAHAYTGIPCAAYIPMMNHHTMPKCGFGPYKKSGAGSFYLPKILTTGTGCLGKVALELSHGKNKQLISLPSEKLDSNKRYFVTFTVKDADRSAMTQGYDGHANSNARDGFGSSQDAPGEVSSK